MALFGLGNLTKKVFPVFPRNIPYRARPKGPPFIFFGTARLFFDFFPQMVPPSIFWCFATEWMLKNPKGSPTSVFRHCVTLARQGLARLGPGAPLGPFFWVCNFFEKFSIFEYCKREYLTLGSLFAIFEPWIWRRLGPVPACFYFIEKFWQKISLA